MTDQNSGFSALADRREFVGTVAGLGGSVYILPGLTSASNSGEDDRVRMVKYHAYNHPDVVESQRDENGRGPVYTTVPRSNWRRHKARQKMIEELNNILQQQFRGIEDIGIGSALQPDRERSKLQVKVGEHLDISTEIIDSTIPDTMSATVSDGMGREEFSDVAVNVVTRSSTKRSNYYSSEYRPIPGGVKIGLKGNGNEYSATACVPAYDNSSGDTVILTAGHNLDAADSYIFQPGPVLYDGGASNKVGPVGDFVNRSYLDAGFFKRSNSGGDDPVVDKLAGKNDDETKEPVDGIVDEGTLMYHVDNNLEYSLNRQGIKTGRTSGQLKDYDTYDPTDRTRFHVDDGGSYDGDSGGPVWEELDGSAYIAGVFFAEELDTGYSRSSTATDVEDDLGVDIGLV